MYLLDTNVVSELRPGKKGAAVAPRHWAANVHLDEQFLSVVTLYELEVGVQLMERRNPAQGAPLRTWLTQLRALFSPRLLPITERISIVCAALQVPDRLPEMDALIAATALEHGLTLVTRNVGDFANRGVSLLNPWSA